MFLLLIKFDDYPVKSAKLRRLTPAPAATPLLGLGLIMKAKERGSPIYYVSKDFSK
jgi:hypothetical protein